VKVRPPRRSNSSVPTTDRRKEHHDGRADKDDGDEVVSYFLEGEGVDVLRESLLWVCEQLMEAEVSELSAPPSASAPPEERLTHRNGYRPRVWATRAGEIVSGDDEEAKRTVAELIDEIGFDPVDAGALARGGRKHQTGAPAYTQGLPTAELRARLSA
jgi:hypothetical protein